MMIFERPRRAELRSHAKAPGSGVDKPGTTKLSYNSKAPGSALRAIQDAHTVSKVKAIHDKAAGWEMHSHHSGNAEAERLYREIRLHAERKGGKLLIYTKKKGLRFTGRPPKGLKIGMLPPDQDTLKKYGITRIESETTFSKR
jgi:hypothetical protein